jgi:phosphoadenosine phosphosulfate reductase
LWGGVADFAKDVRPVWPQERLLVETLLDIPNAWTGKSIWASGSRYYVDGKGVGISLNQFKDADIAKITRRIHTRSVSQYNEQFEHEINQFVQYNISRLNAITHEATDFVMQSASKYHDNNCLVSFSGGKDSTVVADLVVKALRNPSIRHIFGDTTLEMPYTYEYVDRYRKEHPMAVFKTVANREHNFFDVCNDIGPPARMMRWCCTMFKTGPITKSLNATYRNERVLTFYGVRADESTSRSKYNRLDTKSSSRKIQKQAVASPVFYWSDIDIWLYIFGNNIDYNDAYKLGYDRVGCWLCPCNNQRAQFLSKIYMSEQYTAWRDQLIRFAVSIGKPDPQEYVDGGWWKARQGGNGVDAAEDVIVKHSSCTTDQNAKIYIINKPLSEDFFTLLHPFGIVSQELGRKLLGEVLVLDKSTNIPIISVQPHIGINAEGYAIKIQTLNVVDHNDLHRMLGYQVKKHNACRDCLKCEAVCPTSAITIKQGEYRISAEKCIQCKKCVSNKYIEGGCLMARFLKTKVSVE